MDRLKEMRQDFTNMWSNLSQFGGGIYPLSSTASYDLQNLAKHLLHLQEKMELLYRREIVSEVIKGKGLEQHTDEIISGMNQNLPLGIPNAKDPADCTSVDDLMSLLNGRYDYVLEFDLDYVNQWQTDN